MRNITKDLFFAVNSCEHGHPLFFCDFVDSNLGKLVSEPVLNEAYLGIEMLIWRFVNQSVEDILRNTIEEDIKNT